MIWNTNKYLMMHDLPPDGIYFRQAYDFMKSWLSGQEEFILQTSGSTGVPKQILISRKQLTGSALLTGKALKLGAGTHALVCLNTAYVGGLMMLVRGMELDWELTIVEPSANPLLTAEGESGFDFIAMVPMQLEACIDNPETNGLVNNGGKILLGGAPVGLSLQRKIETLQVSVYQSYGMTETVSHVALRLLNGNQATPDYTVMSGVTFGVDERGCLFVAGPMTAGDVIQTNDLVEITSDTTFRWLGRADNVINSGGIKIALDKVDEVIATVFFECGYPNSFFAWHEPDERLGQKLILIVDKTGAVLTGDALLKEIRSTLSAYETPKHVYFADGFIKTPTGKVDKIRTAENIIKSIHG